MANELTALTISELVSGYEKGSFSVTEVTRAYLDRIEKYDPKINSYLCVTKERALEDAEKAEKAISKGETGPLLGVPIGLKDVYATKGIPTTAASKILEGYKPPTNATTTQKLVDAGMVLLGKLNTDEFTMGASTENSAYGPTKNPWDLSRVPGGSSGGSAAATAADLAAGTLGTDTGGSVRQPASLTGTVGLRPTYGRISRSGVFSMASSLDTIGPITKDVTDSAILLKALAGKDTADSTTPDVPVPDYPGMLDGKIKSGLKIGVPKEVDQEGLDKVVRDRYDEALAVYKKMGAELVDISLPHSDLGVAVYYLVNTAEVSANMARYDGIRFGPTQESDDLIELYFKNRSVGFGPEVKRRIILGTFVLSYGYKDAYYSKAQQARSLIAKDHNEAFEKVDIIAMPTSPFPAFKLGEKTDDPISMYLADIFTVPGSLIGIPGISIPCGFTEDNLPIGLQLLSPQFTEDRLLQTAYAYEQATDWHKHKPSL